MASVRTANRGDTVGVARCGKPIVHRRSDLAALDLRVPRPMVTGDEQNHPIAAVNRLLERPVDRIPCVV